MKIAILMATYNGEKYIEQQIQSIINQSEKNWELFISDDGSLDMTLPIVDKLINQDARIHLLSRTKLDARGPLQNFSFLMRSVPNFDYYFFSDQDDIWEEKKIEKTIIKMIELKNPLKLVFTNFSTFSGDNEEDNQPRKALRGQVPFQNLLVQNWIYGCTMAISSELNALSKNIPEEALNHDNWIAGVAVTYGEIAFLDEVLVRRRIHENNVTTNSEKLVVRIMKLMQSMLTNRKKNVAMKNIFLEKIIDLNPEVAANSRAAEFLKIRKKNFFLKNIAMAKNKYIGYSKFMTVMLYLNLI